MRIISAIVILLGLGFTACIKEQDCPYKTSTKVAPVSEEQVLANYLSTNNITATRHSSNMYYEIVSTGAGSNPGPCSSILIKYSGSLTNGSIFDAQDGQLFTLGSLIEGWKIGLPLIKKGGHIRLYIPPSLGYGSSDVKDNNGTVLIPGNSILIFDIELYDFN